MKLKKTFIIAEAGVNHNGELRLAKKLIDSAAASGADAVKFQTFKTEEMVSFKAPKSGYQKKTTSNKENLFQLLKKLELTEWEHEILFKYANKKGIMFLSTPFDLSSADMLYKLGIPIFKIASSDITNFPLLQYVAKKKKPIILSTGRSTLKEVSQALSVIKKAGNNKVSLLHCVSNYPAEFKDLNLKAIETMKKKFMVPVGFSDHSLGVEASIAAVALGAEIIEKHFTLSRKLKGPDHKVSLEPEDLKKMVRSIRNVEMAMGTGAKKFVSSEAEGIKNVRKSLFAKVFIAKGTKISKGMVAIKRPATGIEPKFYEKISGKIAVKNIEADNPITWESVRRKK